MMCRLLLRFRQRTQFLLEIANLVAQPRREFELKLLGGRVHLVGELANEIRKVLRRQTCFENLFMPFISLFFVECRNAEMRVAGLARIAVSAFQQFLRVDVLFGEHVVDVTDLLDQWLRIDVMLFVVGDLNLTTAVRFVDRLRHRIGHLVGIHDDGAGDVTRGTSDRLDERPV